IGSRSLEPQRMLCVVEARPREPLRARHLSAPEYPLVGHGGLDAAVLPHRAPESVEVPDGPAPQLLVALRIHPARAREPAHVLREIGPLHPLGARGPEQIAYFDHRNLQLIRESNQVPPPTGTATAPAVARRCGLPTSARAIAPAKHQAARVRNVGV